MIKNFTIFIVFLLTTFTAHSSEGPDDFLKESVKEVSSLVSQNKERFEKDETFLRMKMNEVVMPKLDITLMSKIILGKKIWTKMTASQQDDFVNAFKYKMTSTYMKSITAFDGEKIEFLPYKPGKKANLAFVKSKYIMTSGDIEVSYRLMRKNQSWKVYDIIFDGISLMKNYRADFRDHVDKNGVQSLINNLRR
tara:strand:+ start:19197 stop:19778 length:582 start_codon:yes stop_codon:yes gene_type:complete